MAAGLADTAMTGDGAPSPSTPLPPVVARYRLQRELGVGGMGVVHAALDPVLERRIALKLLRTTAPDDARKRLVREARAMARLSHPNVVTVHEVGVVGGREYIAMELIDGQNLIDWLHAARRSTAEILAAFLAAGRGLAAAHAVGVVHRDFKPHNVLRSHDGRIVVTDFGLARDVTNDTADDRSLPPDPDLARGSLMTLTGTGSVVGTPAYMPPEQWTAGSVTPATDQFSFCVALWEALTGERPYPGPSKRELYAQVVAGPGALDTSKLPRRLRPVLCRGLDPDPAKRWPSMDALLARITTLHRRRTRPIAIGATAAVLAVVGVYLAHLGQATAPEPCPNPVLDPAHVWPAGMAERLAARGQREAGRQLDADMHAWRNVRAGACHLEPARRIPMLACLDGVLARFDAIARGVDHLQYVPGLDPGGLLVDPALCKSATPPRLVPSISPELAAAFETTMHSDAGPIGWLRPSDAETLVKATSSDPCASAYARVLLAKVSRTLQKDEALQDADACADDRVRADVAIELADDTLRNEGLASTATKLKLAETVLQRIAQPDLAAKLERVRSTLADRYEDLDAAIAFTQRAIAGYATRHRVAAQIFTGLELLDLQQRRARPDDLADVPREIARWRELSVANGLTAEVLGILSQQQAWWTWRTGDIAEAHRLYADIVLFVRAESPTWIRGRVVDEHGVGVRGADVYAAPELSGDALSVSMGGALGQTLATKTGADGQFELAAAVPQGVVIAQLGSLRSAPAEISNRVELRLAPTRHVDGCVRLHGIAAVRVNLIVRDPEQIPGLRYSLVAPVRPDGTFSLDGVPRHKVQVLAEIENGTAISMAGVDVDASRPVIPGLSLSPPISKRKVHVIARSALGAPIDSANVYVVAGRIKSTNEVAFFKEFRSLSTRPARPIVGGEVDQAIVELAKPGDLVATMEVPEGTASACTTADAVATPELREKIDAHRDRVPVQCTVIPREAKVVVVTVPPLPRFD